MKIIKKIFIFILLFSSLALTSCNKEENTENENNNQNQNNNNDNQNIENDNNLEDFVFLDNTLVRYLGNDRVVTIPSYYEKDGKKIEVTEIGAYVFYRDFESYAIVEKVVIPSSVKRICENAFDCCYTLREVVFNEGLEEIEGAAFSRCENLLKIDLPSTIKRIGDEAFYYCESLYYLTIPSGIEEVAKSAFYNCENLLEIYNLSNLDVYAAWEEKDDEGKRYTKVVHSSLSEKSIYTIVDNKFIFLNNDDTYYLFKYTGKESTVKFPTSLTIDGKNIENYIIMENVILYPYVVNVVELGSNISKIKNDAFTRCPNLFNVYVDSAIDGLDRYQFYESLYLKYNEKDGQKYLGNKENPYIVMID